MKANKITPELMAEIRNVMEEALYEELIKAPDPQAMAAAMLPGIRAALLTVTNKDSITAGEITAAALERIAAVRRTPQN